MGERGSIYVMWRWVLLFLMVASMTRGQVLKLPELRIILDEHPVEYSKTSIRIEVETTQLIQLRNLEIALPKELGRNGEYLGYSTTASPALLSGLHFTEEQREAFKARKPRPGEIGRWYCVAMPGVKWTHEGHGPQVALGRAGPTKIMARLSYVVIAREDLEGAEVVSSPLPLKTRSIEAATRALKAGRRVTVSDKTPVQHVDAELVFEVQPRSLSFAQVSKAEGMEPFWYWDGLWVFREGEGVSAVSPKGERFVWKNVAPRFFRYEAKNPTGTADLRVSTHLGVEGDIGAFRKQFPELDVPDVLMGPGRRAPRLMFSSDIGDRGFLELAEKLEGTRWFVDRPLGFRRIVIARRSE